MTNIAHWADNKDVRPQIRRGKGKKPVLEYGERYIKLPFCPDCDGRGWFLINPFATGGGNGCGGLGNMTICLTCKDAHRYFLTYFEMPPELLEIPEFRKAYEEWKAKKI